MTEIESLIKQAKESKEKWKKPVIKRGHSTRTWQEILDNKPYPHLRHDNL